MSGTDSKIARNTLFLYIRMLFIMFVSLYTSRVVLNVLGVMDYGVYCVVGAFVSMFSFFNATLSSSMQRFYNFDIGSSGGEHISEIYSEGLFIHLILAGALLLILETAGVWYLNNLMVIPPERMTAANILFQLTIATSIVSLFQIPYMGAVMAYEKMDFYAIISIMDAILKLAVVFLLPRLPYDKIIVYGALLLAISIIDLLCYFVYTKKCLDGCVLIFVKKHTFLKEILSFSGWNLMGTLMFMIKTQVLSLLLNYFFNPVVNAARGLAIQVSGAVNGFSSNITVAFRPQLTNSYAEGDRAKVRRLMFVESKICYFLILLLMTPLAIEIDYVLYVWLGDAIPENTNIFIVLTLVDALVCTLNTPCTQVVFAVGNLKRYQIAATIVNFLIMPTSWLMLHMGASPSAVFFATIAFSVINQAVCLFITSKVFPLDLKHYAGRVLLPCLLATVVLPAIPLFLFFEIEQGFFRFVLVCLTTLVTAVPLCLYVVLDKVERRKLIYSIRVRIRR